MNIGEKRNGERPLVGDLERYWKKEKMEEHYKKEILEYEQTREGVEFFFFFFFKGDF